MQFSGVAFIVLLLLPGCVRAGFDHQAFTQDGAADRTARAELTGGTDASAACSQLFSALTGPLDRLCPLSATGFCRVAATLEKKSSCQELCAQHGTTCLGTMMNNDGEPCLPSGYDTCDTEAHWTSICNCKLPGTAGEGCVDRFPEALVCSSAGDACVVAAPLFGTSCTAYCGSHGAPCEATQLKASGKDLCLPSASASCDTVLGAIAICTCR